MKRIFLISSIVLLLFSCKKDKQGNNVYKVRYSVTGNSVNQFKITDGALDITVVTPFSGTKDTTVYLLGGTTVKLDTKADNINLVGSIYVNDVLQSTATDTDPDGDGKTEVKIDYAIPPQH